MLVGRARELDVLRGMLARAARDAGGVGLLVGEAGVGKSHLLGALVTEARERGFEVAVGRCFADTGQRAFAPWREALGDAAIDAGPTHHARLGALDDRARSFERVLAAVRERAAARPLLVAIDDLHWADRDSSLLFLHVARFGLSDALLLIGTVRAPDLDAASNVTLDHVLAELARDARAESLTLRPFTEAEIAEAAAAVAGGSVPQSLARALHAETRGNPLYVRELVRHLIEEGKLELHEGRVASDFAASELALPPSIRHVVRQRVARLSDRAVSLLRCSAAAGGPAELATLADAAGLVREEALDALDDALRSGVLRTSGSRYELSHAIVRRAIYEELNPDRRARLHRRVAEALEAAKSADRAEIAAQYHASRELSGAEAGVPHALHAAEAARATGAHERAASFLAIAYDLSAPLGDEALAGVGGRLALARAEALDAPGAIEALEQATSRLGRSAELHGAVARALEAGGAPRAEWGPLVSAGLAAVGERRDLCWARLSLLAREPISVLSGPAWVSRFRPYDAEAVRLLRETGSEADFASTVDPHDHRTPAETEALLGRTERWSDPAAALRVLDTCARDLFFRGLDFHRTVERMSEVLALSERVGSLAGEVAARVVLTCCWAPLGDFERARSTLARAREISTRLGSMHRMNVVGPLAAETALGHFVGADWSRVAQPLVDFVTSPRAAGTPFGIVALSLGLLGTSIGGDPALAARLFPAHLDALEALPVEINEWGAGRDCGATAAWLLGAKEHAPRYLELALRHASTAGSACWSSASHSSARLTALLGDLDRARRLFDESRECFAATGRHPCLSICDYDEALAYVRNGRGDDARVTSLIDAAAKSFEAFGMEPWLKRARELGQPAQARRENPDGLTEREVEVLRLVAQGFANKEIAAKLFVSVPTVERHVANIYGKIGRRGRAAAAAYALRKGLVPE